MGASKNCKAIGAAVVYHYNAVNGIVIGDSAVISGNTCKNLIYDTSAENEGYDKAMVVRGSITGNACNGCVFYGGNKGRPVELYGKVNDNTMTGTGGVFYFGANRRVTMHEDSEICNNTVENGAVVSVNGEGNTFTMNGGTITGNTVTNGSVFRFTSGSWQQGCTMIINDGDISSNDAPYVYEITTGGKLPGTGSYFEMPDIGSDEVHFAPVTHTENKVLVTDYVGKVLTVKPGTKLGHPNRNQNTYSIPDAGIGSDLRNVTVLETAATNWNCKAPSPPSGQSARAVHQCR